MSTSLADMITIVEKIDHHRHDHTTRQPRFAPLWEYPFLREVFLQLLQGWDQESLTESDWANFHNVCDILCPEFSAILREICLDDGSDLTNPPADLYQTMEPDVVASGLSQVTIC